MKLNNDRLALEVRRARIPFMLFLLLIAAGLTAGWVIFKNQTVQWPWQDTYKVRVAFDDVKGVQPGHQQVRLAGVPVGVIEKSELVGGHPVLTLSLEKKYAPLYRDARVRLRPATPLQDMYAAIALRGTARTGKLTSTDILPADRAVTPVDISRVLNTFNADTRTRLAHLLDGLGSGLADRGAQLRAAFVQLAPFLRSAQRLTQTLTARRQDTSHLVHNLRTLTEALGQREDELTALVTSGNSTLGALARNDAPLARTLRELPPALQTSRSSFRSVRAAETELDPAVRGLEPVAGALRPGLQALERFGRDATPALASLRPSVRALRPLATALAPVSASLKRSFESLTPQAPRLDRMTARVVPCELAIQKFFQWTLSVGKFGDAYGAFPRGQINFGSDSAGGLVQQPGYARHRSCAQDGDKK